MFLNIITPCSRPHNLIKISQSINIPRDNYKWIVVCDDSKYPGSDIIPDNCIFLLHKDRNSIYGNAQRNFGLNFVYSGHVYFNDDDTTIHPELWKSIQNLKDFDFIHFPQLFSNGEIRIKSDIVRVGYIDSHNFICSRDCVGKNKWIVDKWEADGYFAESVYKNSKNPIYLNKPLSIYNYLR